MTGSDLRSLMRTCARDFLPTLWPASSAADSEFQRRRKIAVRSAQLAAAALVVVSVAAAVAASFGDWSTVQLIESAAVALAYIAWNVLGTRDVVQELLWEPGRVRPVRLMQEGWVIGFCAIQLVLAVAIYCWPSPKTGILWLILLPPVAHSVILLRAPGISVVSTLTMIIFGVGFVRWHGWESLLAALLAFGFAVLFTLVFTLLAVSSERARSEVQRLACELGEANGKLREYAVQAEELAVTRERNRLAREIHDTLGHYLTVVNVQIEAARVMVERDPVRAHDALNKAQSFTQEGLVDIRRSVAALRASPLDNKTLTEAIRLAVEGVQSNGLKAELKVVGEGRPLSRPAELTLYRAAQEGLTNVQKHARAKHAFLVLDFQSGGRVRLTVTDDGVGSAEQTNQGFGLLGLRERAHLAGGELRVRTAPAAGFVLEMEVPG